MNWLTFRAETWVERMPGGAALAGTLLHSLWEGAVVALALAVALYFARSARARYGAACLAMVVLLSGLVVTFTQLVPAPPIHTSIAGAGGIPNMARLAGDALPPVPPRDARLTDYMMWLVPVWIAGVVVFYLRGITSWMAARRLRQTGVCCAPDLWQSRLARLRMRLRVTRPVALLESCLAEVPVVIGYVRPIILMPVGLLAGLPAGQVEAILLHELAHIRRYDYLVNLLQVFVEGLLFYHPAVWWISGVMRTERENCCDDLVVAVTGGALEYATALTALEQRRENAGMALAATGGNLMKRIQRLLGRPERSYAAVMPVFTAAILTVTVVTAVAALQWGPAEQEANRAALQANTTSAPARQMPPAVKAVAPEHAEQLTAGLSAVRLKMPLFQAAQAAPDAGAVQMPLTAEQQKAKEDALKQELMTPYKKWMQEDVAYIISDEERKAFRQLNDDEERGKFVEQFWLRRDPTPGTSENEFKEEIYRRIAYVNEHFGAPGLAGWRTDRGRIYIQYGPPDEIEAHSSGGTSQAPLAVFSNPPKAFPLSQGSVATETFPYEQWRYRYIDGVGQNVILEFVDKTGKGEYKMTMDPNERNFLLNVPATAPR